MLLVARVDAWRRMSGSARTATVMAGVLLPVIEASLRLLGVSRTLTWLRATVPSRPAAHVTPRVLRLAVNRASRRGLVAGRCLSKSLALWWLMARTGSSSRLRLGVAVGNAAFDAHAWLEDETGVINDDDDVGTRYPASFVALQ